MIEAKEMLRELWGTKNVYTYGVGGTGFSGLDCVLSMILPGDKVVVFTNGTFSAIDGLTIRMKASTNEDLAAGCRTPKPKNVITIGTRRMGANAAYTAHAWPRTADFLPKTACFFKSFYCRLGTGAPSVIETTFQFGKVSKLLLHASYLDLRGARMTLLLRSSLSNMLPIAEHQQH